VLDTAGGYHADLLPLVEHSPEWERAFETDRVVVFLRRSDSSFRETMNR
jgi:hypothetical protein